VGGFGGSGGSGGFTGDCCTPHSWPGCGDPGVTACVCSQDPFCCQSSWDGLCASEVTQLNCGTCGGTGGSAGFGGAGGFGGSFGGSAGFGGSFGGSAGSSGAGGAGGSGGIGECLNQFPGACGQCLCTSCFSELGSCIADFGCPVILQCIDQTGCSGIGCYQPNTCQGVIDSFGGPFGPSTQKAVALAFCSSQSACPC
jgi:hypothetical protein